MLEQVNINTDQDNREEYDITFSAYVNNINELENLSFDINLQTTSVTSAGFKDLSFKLEEIINTEDIKVSSDINYVSTNNEENVLGNTEIKVLGDKKPAFETKIPIELLNPQSVDGNIGTRYFYVDEKYDYFSSFDDERVETLNDVRIALFNGMDMEDTGTLDASITAYHGEYYLPKDGSGEQSTREKASNTTTNDYFKGLHEGTDIALGVTYDEKGNEIKPPVYSLTNGVVKFTKMSYGQLGIEDKTTGKLFIYAHMDWDSISNYKEGDIITIGQEIGIQSGTGASGKDEMADHVHLEVYNIEDKINGILKSKETNTLSSKHVEPYEALEVWMNIRNEVKNVISSMYTIIKDTNIPKNIKDNLLDNYASTLHKYDLTLEYKDIEPEKFYENYILNWNVKSTGEKINEIPESESTKETNNNEVSDNTTTNNSDTENNTSSTEKEEQLTGNIDNNIDRNSENTTDGPITDPNDVELINKYKEDWEKAHAVGDEEGMKAAHEQNDLDVTDESRQSTSVVNKKTSNSSSSSTSSSNATSSTSSTTSSTSETSNNVSTVNKSDEELINQYKEDWERAKAAGDEEAMARAHDNAETVRAKYGFSGGENGDEYNTIN